MACFTRQPFRWMGLVEGVLRDPAEDVAPLGDGGIRGRRAAIRDRSSPHTCAVTATAISSARARLPRRTGLPRIVARTDDSGHVTTACPRTRPRRWRS